MADEPRISPDDTRWFTPQDLAEMLEISEVSIRGWARDKEVFPNAYMVGRKDSWHIPVPDVYNVVLNDFNVPRYRARFFEMLNKRWHGDERINPPTRKKQS